jgi:hypothetical chaperone protein
VALSCGIDFGTSNTSVVLVRNGVLEAVPVDPRSRIAETIPTLLYWGTKEGPPQFGTAAVEAWLGEEMGGRFIQSVKKHLPAKSFQSTWIRDRERTIEEIVGAFLRHLKVAVDELAGASVTRVVLGRPAKFSIDPDADRLAETRLREAARLAGFEEIVFLIEPIAAARAFEESLTEEVLCLVGDLGGGTSDFSIVRLGPRSSGDREGDVLGVGGVPIAGNDFDARIVWTRVTPLLGRDARYRPSQNWVPIPTALHHAICRWHTLSFAARDREKIAFLDQVLRTADDVEGLSKLRALLEAGPGYLFFEAVEGAKVRLSSTDDTRLVFEFEKIDLDVAMTRQTFERSIADETRAIAQCMDALLADVGATKEDIGVVFLTGGTSRVPVVWNLFAERFGVEKIADQNVFTSVGRGLGLEALARFG